VNAAEALAGANERRSFLLSTLSLLLVAIAALAVAAWRHGSSVRARHQADELRDKAAKLQRQTDLLHTITDNLDVLTVLINREQEVIFTNQATASAGNSIADVGGLSGSSAARRPLGDLGDDVRRQRLPLHRVLPLTIGGALKSFQVSLIPVERIGERRQLVLLVLSDVTELKVAEQEHADLLRELVGKLSDAVALHDPYVHHASHGGVAQAVARARVPDAERETFWPRGHARQHRIAAGAFSPRWNR
jgi:PAS domain-containing protein